MGKTFQGHLVATGLRFGIVVARFNGLVTEQLLSGAQDALVRHGADPDQIDVAWVPGAFELSIAVQRMAAAGRYDAVVALGCVIRGATPHFDYVAAEAARGVATATAAAGVPVTFGVLTTDTIEQALERAGTKAGNKGADAALAAVEMANLLRALG